MVQPLGSGLEIIPGERGRIMALLDQLDVQRASMRQRDGDIDR